MNFVEFVKTKKTNGRHHSGFFITSKAFIDFIETHYILSSVVERESGKTLEELKNENLVPPYIWASFSLQDDPTGMYVEGWDDLNLGEDYEVEINILESTIYHIDPDNDVIITSI